MKTYEININDIFDFDISIHGETLDNYRHNESPIIVICCDNDSNSDCYALVTGGHRYNSACKAGYTTIEAYIIHEDMIDFEDNPLVDLQELNEESDIIERLGKDNFY